MVDEEEEKKEEHPLQNEWVLWEHKANTGSSKNSANQWKENMMALCSFKTVEEFWRYYNNIPKPSQVFFDGEYRKRVGGTAPGKVVEEYSLFKKGIEPEWGDPKNVTGGEWFCRQFFEGDVLDLYWQNLVLALIGETIEDVVGGSADNKISNVCNGVRVVDKGRAYPMFKLELWIQSRDEQVKNNIKKKLMEIITDGQPARIKAHPKFDWKDHSA